MRDIHFIDLVLLLIILVSAWRGYRKGGIAGMIELTGWMGSLYLAFLVYPYTAKFIESEIAANSILLFGLAFLLTIFLARLGFSALLNRVIDRIPEKALHTPADKLAGIIPGTINGLVYASLLSALLLLLPFSWTLSAAATQSRVANKLDDFLQLAEEKFAPGFRSSIQRSLTKMSTETGSDELVMLNFKVSDHPARPDLEARMLQLVNAERAKEGLGALKPDTALRAVARAHAADMFERGYFSHYSLEQKSPFDRIQAANIPFLAAGENLALAPSLELAHEGLMNSPGHRANILQPAFGRVGIGILDGGRYGIMVTQNFRN